jgi:choline kinase
MTRTIILAAGQGTRLRPLTENLPKAMVPLCGIPLIHRQLKTLESEGLKDIHVVGGYRAEALGAGGFQVIMNPAFESTNMVASLHCAKHLFDGEQDVVVSYGDIVYEPRVLRALLAAQSDLSVVVDMGWQQLWSFRMEDPLADAETMRLGPQGQILELGGKPTSPDQIEGQYIGLFKVGRRLAPRFFDLLESLDPSGSYEGRPPHGIFMTTYLQMLIDHGLFVLAVPVEHGWLEVDSVLDLKRYEAAHAEHLLEGLCRIEN